MQSPKRCRHPQGCSGEGLGCREPVSAEQMHFAIKLGILQLSVCLSVHLSVHILPQLPALVRAPGAANVGVWSRAGSPVWGDLVSWGGGHEHLAEPRCGERSPEQRQPCRMGPNTHFQADLQVPPASLHPSHFAPRLVPSSRTGPWSAQSPLWGQDSGISQGQFSCVSIKGHPQCPKSPTK